MTKMKNKRKNPLEPSLVNFFLLLTSNNLFRTDFRKAIFPHLLDGVLVLLMYLFE